MERPSLEAASSNPGLCSVWPKQLPSKYPTLPGRPTGIGVSSEQGDPFWIQPPGGRQRISLGKTKNKSLTHGLISSGAACSLRTCRQVCCHNPTYSLGRCRSVTRGLAARFQMHFQVASSSCDGYCEAWECSLLWVSPFGGFSPQGVPQEWARKWAGWVPSVFVGGPGPK